MSFTCTATGNAVSVNLARKEGKFQPWWKQVEVRVFGAERAPREVLVNGQRTADFKHDPATRSVSVQVPAGTADVRVTY